MISSFAVLLAGLAWVAVLFGVALYGERRAARITRLWPIVYALSLAVYCTSWTFYGTVTQAARWQAWLPPTFIGTMLLFFFGTGFLARLAELARRENSASLADLIAARFGKSRSLASAITAVAVFGMVPYVALQLKAVAMSYALLTGGGIAAPPAWQDAAFWVALTMMAFALLFGTRRASATEHNRGLILAIAFESLFKLAALLAVGAFALGSGPAPALPFAEPIGRPDGGFVALIGLGALAMFTLPHQFHVGTVELRDAAHLRTARWLFPLYLLLIALPILPLALIGRERLGADFPSDLYTLGLPLASGEPKLALFAFLGGLSAATGMVILAAITLSIMIANHWIAPYALRAAAQSGDTDLRPVVLAQRRAGIVLVIAMAYGYSRLMGASDALADIGALSFSALAQLAPALVAAVYRPGLGARAVLVGLATGALVWIWLLLVPVAMQAGVVPDLQSLGTPAWITPQGFLGLGALDPLARGVLVSLVCNVLAMLVAARLERPSMPAPGDGIGVGALSDLVRRFLPAPELERLFAGRERNANADAALIAASERELAAVVGAASARLLVDAARGGRNAPLDAVATLVGETSQALRFNQQLLEAALQNMSQGISVVDTDLRLVAWNDRYAALFGYPETLLRVGVPVQALVQYNADRGLLGEGSATSLVERRLHHMRAGTPYISERRFPDGSVVEIRGNPMPGGGFVATFTDVTAFRSAESALKRANETLEQRVDERTRESEAARAEAERANLAKSRFLAAVSHDLLQPVHAAHLFAHALSEQLRHPQYGDAVRNIEGALSSAEGLLGGLLDISRLDAGGMTPRPQPFCIADLLHSLASEFSVLAHERGLALHWVPCRAWLRSDAQLLRRVLQNFLANAVRYTQHGRILIGCRRSGEDLRIEVWDTGPGIAEAHRGIVFEEFRRLDHGGQGLGIGLAIADRIARLLDHRLGLRSAPGRGSVFSIAVPITAPAPLPTPMTPDTAALDDRVRVLVVDNDDAVMRGMRSLLEGWHCEVLVAGNARDAEALAIAARPALLLLDYHLDDGDTGLALHARLRARLGEVPAIVISADHGEALRQAAAAAGCHLLHKPLKPLALKSLMARLLGPRAL
jgi:signal transduction histidine kinase/Na+/proline symporter